LKASGKIMKIYLEIRGKKVTELLG